MSSHHFVKENQEPALLILDTEAIPFDKVQELLEWSPTVIVTEQSLNTVLGWGIKIDVVFASPERISDLTLVLQDQTPVRFVSFHHDQEIIAIVFDFLKTSQQKAVNILARSTEDFEKINIAKTLDCDLFFEGKRWTFAKEGKFKKWFVADMQLYIYPPTTQFGKVEGLTKSFVNDSNGMAVLESKSPFWIGEDL